MKPLRLEVEGLTSFAERTVVDFTDLQLFAITGATGAGKSSLIDAMLLALFGKVPRVHNRPAQLISHGKDQLAVMLDFAVRDRRYRVTRRIKSRGAGAGAVQLEQVTDQGTQSLAGRSRDVDAEIVRILGIGYDAFTRSVVLPQGEFDRFLKGEPKERRAILTDLLGLETYRRMSTLAGDHQRQLQLQLENTDRQLQRDFAEATAEHRDRLAAECAAAEDTLRTTERRAGTLAAAVEQARELRAARALAASTAAQAGRLQQQQQDAAQALQQAQDGAAGQAAELATLQQQLADATTDPARLAAITRALLLLDRLLRLATALPQLQAEQDQAATATARARRELQQAETALPQLASAVQERAAERAAAQARLDEHRRQHAAAHLRAALQPGQPCPVCAQPVRTVPAGTAPPLDSAERALQEAAHDEKQAERLHAVAERTRKDKTKELPEVEQRERDAAARHQQAFEERQQLAAEVAALTGSGEADAGASQRALTAERTAIERTAADRQRAAARLDDLRAAHGARQRTIAAAQAQLELLLPQLDAARTATDAARAAAERTAAAMAAALQAAAEPAPAPPRRTGDADELQQLQLQQAEAAAATAAQSRRLGQLQQQLAEIERRIAAAAELRAGREQLAAQAAVARSMALLLHADRFQDYVQEEAIAILGEDGAARLRTLSQGRYSLRHEAGEFLVVDHWNADRPRSVRTLSGGETFLASLALSLALAERIAALAAGADGTSALECLFIDEGFGALDREALDTAVDALEVLHGGQRMVGIVTHLPQLAARLPARIAVENAAGRARIAIS